MNKPVPIPQPVATNLTKAMQRATAARQNMLAAQQQFSNAQNQFAELVNAVLEMKGIDSTKNYQVEIKNNTLVLTETKEK